MTDRMKNLADQVRASHDAKALSAYMASEFEPANDINASHTCEPERYISDFPIDLDQRIKALQVRLASEEEAYRKDFARYTKIRTEGLSALTDLEIAYNGNCDPVMAVRSPLLILGSHIAFGKAKLPFLREQLATCLKARSAAGEQLAMF